MGLIKKGSLIEKGVIELKETDTSYSKEPFLVQPIEHNEIKDVEEPELQPESSEAELPQVEEQTTGENMSVELPAIEDKEELVSYAKGEAEEIIKKAMEEAESIKEQAREAGLAEAQSFAEENASDKVKEALATLNQAVVERKKIIKDSEQEILRLAVRVAEQVIRNEVSTNRNVAMNMVTDAVTRISDREQVIIRVNREDLENIKKYKDKIGSVVDGIKSLSIVEDSSVEPGGCVIETNLGYVDARISTKLAAIEEAFRKAK
jgi:flagellar assembly protein FliH